MLREIGHVLPEEVEATLIHFAQKIHNAVPEVTWTRETTATAFGKKSLRLQFGECDCLLFFEPETRELQARVRGNVIFLSFFKSFEDQLSSLKRACERFSQPQSDDCCREVAALLKQFELKDLMRYVV